MTSAEKIKIAKREYARRWREKNRARVKKYQDDFYLRMFEELQLEEKEMGSEVKNTN